MQSGNSLIPNPNETKSRKTKSLAYLATEFVRLVRSQENETIDVMRAAGILGVEKRRIYDITNALMGANVLQKQGKSHYKWIGGSVLDGDDSEKAELLAQKERLEQQNAELDEIIQNFSQYIQTTYYNNPDVVLTTDELLNSCQKMEGDLQNKIVLAFTAPPGTDVYVKNGEKGNENEIFLSSPGGEILTYLLPTNTENNSLSQMAIANNVITPTTPTTPTLTQQPDFQISTPKDFNMNMDSLNMSPSFSTDYGLQELFTNM